MLNETGSTDTYNTPGYLEHEAVQNAEFFVLGDHQTSTEKVLETYSVGVLLFFCTQMIRSFDVVPPAKFCRLIKVSTSASATAVVEVCPLTLLFLKE